MERDQLKNILEAALLAADRPLPLDSLLALFEDAERPSRDAVQEALESLQADYARRGVELKLVASGYRIQVRPDYQRWVSRLWEERAPRYSRALMETLALIAYRQPITRGEIEAVRGVSVSTNIVRTLRERDWIQVVGHRDVPGKPALYATTRKFLDYFNLSSLDDLPSLMELRDIDQIEAELNFGDVDVAGTPAPDAGSIGTHVSMSDEDDEGAPAETEPQATEDDDTQDEKPPARAASHSS